MGASRFWTVDSKGGGQDRSYGPPLWHIDCTIIPVMRTSFSSVVVISLICLLLPTTGIARGKSAKALFVQTEQLLEKGETKKAARVLRRLEKMKESHLDTRPLQAEYSKQTGDYSTTIKIYKVMAHEARSKKRVTLLLKVADLYGEIGDWDHREKMLLETLREDPLNPTVHYALGKFKLVHRHDRKGAIRYFQEYLKRAKEGEETQKLRQLVKELKREASIAHN